MRFIPWSAGTEYAHVAQFAIGLMPQVKGTQAVFTPKAGTLQLWEKVDGLGLGTGIVIEPSRVVNMTSHTDAADQTQALCLARTDASGNRKLDAAEREAHVFRTSGTTSERRGALRGSIKRWLDRVHPEDRDRFRTAFDTLVELRRGKVSADIRLAAHDGTFRTFRMRVKPVLGGDGQVNRIVGTLQDVNEDRASRERLLHDAVHDSLTGLPNKQLLLDRLERALVRLAR
jgi:hypothetical protein